MYSSRLKKIVALLFFYRSSSFYPAKRMKIVGSFQFRCQRKYLYYLYTYLFYLTKTKLDFKQCSSSRFRAQNTLGIPSWTCFVCNSFACQLKSERISSLAWSDFVPSRNGSSEPIHRRNSNAFVFLLTAIVPDCFWSSLHASGLFNARIYFENYLLDGNRAT